MDGGGGGDGTKEKNSRGINEKFRAWKRTETERAFSLKKLQKCLTPYDKKKMTALKIRP